jgi:hypothetical protein
VTDGMVAKNTARVTPGGTNDSDQIQCVRDGRLIVEGIFLDTSVDTYSSVQARSECILIIIQ